MLGKKSAQISGRPTWLKVW
jgi:hypothetical protein